MNKMRKPALIILALATGVFAQRPSAQTQPPASPIAQKIAGSKELPGFFNLYVDNKAGKIWLEIRHWNTDVLYYPSLPAGLGQNDIGLDRGQLGQERIVRFERFGAKALLIQHNARYIASAADAAERKAVEDSFAQSVLWGFEIAAGEGDRVIVDATKFFLRDAHGVMPALTRSKQGTWRLDDTRSALYEPRTRSFPKNTEVEVLLTFTSDAPGNLVNEVAPQPESITVREHHSFVELPGPGFTPREFDPNSGFFPGADFVDYSTPLGEPMRKRYIARHRLQKNQTLTYYLDNATPEPIRSALLDGARWWSQAFAAAGFPEAFKVEILPVDADPMDIRYNMIQWVHRSTRGWSYGAAVTDPRTGEILKGHVTLGSLRVRQDYMIAEGLLAPYEAGKPSSPGMESMALARLRQLSAHEVGHTLGLAHNYIASTEGRASVMDYPHPLVLLQSAGGFDLAKAYATGIGEWDKVAVTWGYGELDKAGRDAVLANAHKKGLRFITDADSRPAGSPHPASHLWDNGENPIDELNRVMQVRRKALERFGQDNIKPGQPMSALEDVLVPLFLAHRYQVEAAAKMIAGLDYNYALRGDGQFVTKMVPAAEQRRALDALLKTILPNALSLPEKLLDSIPPRAFEYNRTRENFHGHTGLTFDADAPAEAAANLTIGLILNSERAARLIEYHSRDRSNPSLAEVIDRILNVTLRAATPAGQAGEVKKTVDYVVVYHLMALSIDDAAPAEVRAVAWAKLRGIGRSYPDGSDHAYVDYIADMVERFRKEPGRIPLPKPAEPPPGQPI